MVLWRMCFQQKATQEMSFSKSNLKKISQKVDFIRAQNLGIFDIMGWIKFLPRKKTIQSPGETNSLREAILFDHTSDIGITIWGN